MADRYNNINNTAPIQGAQDNQKIDVPRSAFNYSRMRNFTGLIGALMPFDVMETLPNEDYKISYDVLCLARNPLVRRLLSNMRIYIHTYYSKWSDLWEGAQNFITKGRSGSIEMNMPKINQEIEYDSKTYSFSKPLGLADYMTIPPAYFDKNHIIDSYVGADKSDVDIVSLNPQIAISALPFVMYQRIYRDKYVNKNLTQNNKMWLPDNEEHFILPYECEEANYLDYDNPLHDETIYDPTDPDGGLFVPIVETDPTDNEAPFLSAIRFRQFKGDYFNTGLPFADLIRGEAPVLDLGSIITSIDWSDVVQIDEQGTKSYDNISVGLDDINKKLIAGIVDPIGNGNQFDQELLETLNKAKLNAQLNASINLNSLRALEAYTIFMERNARTDGDYDDLIKAQFGYNPHAGNKEPYYIGGMYQDIVFSEVVQTSESTESSPLGTTAGRGASAHSGYVGSFHSPDYGYIMSIMSIVPDTFYTQGVDRMFTKLNQSEMYFPILNNLSPQAIKNKELFTTGTEETDEDVFAWTERYSEFKSRQNRVSGLMALPHDVADFDASLIMARRFDETPQLNNQFITMSPKNIDMSVFTVSDEPPFDISVACRIDKVSPMPYITVPGGLSARA